MKKIIFPMALVAIVIGITSFVCNDNELAYVDINKLLDGYDRTKIERKAFEKKTHTLQANVDSLMSDWQNELKAYEKEQASMTKKERELKQRLLANKQQRLNTYQKAVQKQIQEEDRKMTQTVINDINDYVKEYGKKEGHAIIFGAGGNGNIMYAMDAADITQKVLDGLNTRYNGK